MVHATKNSTNTRLGGLLLTMLVMLTIPAHSWAQSELPPGVDIVFVVDQSGSMSKGSIIDNDDRRCKPMTDACPRTPPTDPNNLALRALPDGLSPIFEQIVVRTQEREQLGMTKKEYRFGLVLFGGTPDPAQPSAITKVPLTPIEIREDGAGNLVSNIEEQQLLPTEASNMGDTAFSSAFTEACIVLSCTTPVPEGRERVIVLLTDGQPSNDPGLTFDPQQPERYFDALEQRHEELFSSTQVNVIGLDANDQFWPRVEPFWQRIAEKTQGTSIRITDPRQIAQHFRTFATEAIGAPLGNPRPCDNSTFSVAPYKASLQLILQYPDTDSSAQFQLPDGQALTKEYPGANYRRSAQTESFIITNPPPGDWRCTIVGGGVDTQFRDIQGEFSLADVDVARPVDTPGSTCSEFSFVVSYRDRDGNAISELPNYPLVQTATITVGNTPTTRKLVPTGDARDQWAVSGTLQPDRAGGSYPVAINVQLTDGTPVFTDVHQKLLIDPQLPCMQIIAPENGSTSETHNRLTPTDFEVAVQLTQGGTPALPNGVFREDLSKIVTGHVEGPDGLRRAIQLAPDPSQPGKLAARVSGLPAGTYRFRADLNAQTQDGTPYVLTSQPVTFERVPGAWRQNFLLAMRGVAAVIALILAGGVAWFCFLLAPPFPRGRLVFEQRATGAAAEFREWEALKTIPLSSARMLFGLLPTRHPTIKRGLPKALGIRKLKVRRVASGKNEGVSVVGVRDGNKPALSLQFPRDQAKHTIDGNIRVTYENNRSRQRSSS